MFLPRPSRLGREAWRCGFRLSALVLAWRFLHDAAVVVHVDELVAVGVDAAAVEAPAVAAVPRLVRVARVLTAAQEA